MLISNEDMGIKTHAGEIIGDLIKILSEEDRGKYILTLVLNMAHDDTNENNRIVAVQVSCPNTRLILMFSCLMYSYWAQWQVVSGRICANNSSVWRYFPWETIKKSGSERKPLTIWRTLRRLFQMVFSRIDFCLFTSSHSFYSSLNFPFNIIEKFQIAHGLFVKHVWRTLL